MSKPQKIKRYNNIYKRRNQRKKSTWKIVLAVVILAGFVFVGYSAAGPLMNFLAGRRNNSDTDPSVNVSSSEAEDPEESTAEPEPSDTDTFIGKVMPASSLQDSAAVDEFIQAAKEEGYTAVVVECKDSQGYLYYTSGIELANSQGAVYADAIDISTAAAKITEAGLTPAAKIHAFQDDISSNVQTDTSFQYNGGSQRWLDNSLSAGGKGWLNPFKDAARQYIIDITNELIDNGFKTVMIDSVQFPDVTNLGNAGLGDKNNDVEKSSILQQFVSEVTSAANAKGASVIIQVKGGGFIGQHANLYSMDVVNFGAEAYAPVLDFSSMGTNEVYETTKSVLSVGGEANSTSAFIPVITDQSTFEETRRALDELSIQSYMVEG